MLKIGTRIRRSVTNRICNAPTTANIKPKSTNAVIEPFRLNDSDRIEPIFNLTEENRGAKNFKTSNPTRLVASIHHAIEPPKTARARNLGHF